MTPKRFFPRAYWGVAGIVSLSVACALSSSNHYDDGICPEGTKLCGEACVSKGNPDFGCGAIDCSPCNLSRAQASCSADGKCAIATCYQGRSDCNGNPADGCESDTASSVESCGSCTNRCSYPNAVPSCTAGNCGLGTCNERFGDCNGLASDGCETDLSQSPNCGACGVVCPASKECKVRRTGGRWTAVCESNSVPTSDASTTDAGSDAESDAGADDGGI